MNIDNNNIIVHRAITGTGDFFSSKLNFFSFPNSCLSLIRRTISKILRRTLFQHRSLSALIVIDLSYYILIIFFKLSLYCPKNFPIFGCLNLVFFPPRYSPQQQYDFFQGDPVMVTLLLITARLLMDNTIEMLFQNISH